MVPSSKEKTWSPSDPDPPSERPPLRTLRRFTDDEDRIIREDYLAYVPTVEIATKLERSIGTVQQRILVLGLRRSGAISRLLEWAPEHLRANVGTMEPNEWIAACHAWRDEQREQQTELRAEERELKRTENFAIAAEIDAKPDHSRNEKMKLMRMAGLTLEEIASLYSVTRERVRQIVDPLFVPPAVQHRLGVADRMAKLKAKIEGKNTMLVDRALKQLQQLWEACPHEAQERFRTFINENEE